MLVEHLLPLAERGGASTAASTTSAATAGGAAAVATSADDSPPLGEEELLARASTLEVVFQHYCEKVRSSSGAGASAAAAPTFWDELKQERLALGQPADDAAMGNDAATSDAGSSASRRGGSLQALSLDAWQRLMGHFGVCPTLLSKAELGRLFQSESLRQPPTNHLTFVQFAHALGAVAASAFPPDRVHDPEGNGAVQSLAAAMKLDNTKMLQQRPRSPAAASVARSRRARRIVGAPRRRRRRRRRCRCR